MHYVLQVVVLSVFVCYSTCDDILIVTGYLDNGDPLEAVRLSRVEPSIGGIHSHAGFFSIKNRCDSNVFFWYLPAQKRNSTEAPTILWHQGGPGTSSLLGLMTEIGSLRYRNHSGLMKVESHWNDENNLLIIDGAGTGFSFGKANCCPKNEEEIGEDLYQGLIQFYTMFPELQVLPFIAAGQSYGCKITAALARIILSNNPTAEIKINLTALIMISAFIHPIRQQGYGSYLYSLGLIDWRQRILYEEQECICLNAIKDQNWFIATEECNALTGELYFATVGDVSLADFSPREEDNNDWIDFVQSPEIRKALHVGDLKYSLFGLELYNALYLRYYQSVKHWIEHLLDRQIPLVFINGQRDITDPYKFLVLVLQELNWEGKQNYLDAKRVQWCDGNTQAGYFKSALHLHEFLVLDAGHNVPGNQPARVLEIVKSVTTGSLKEPLQNLKECEKTEV